MADAVVDAPPQELPKPDVMETVDPKVGEIGSAKAESEDAPNHSKEASESKGVEKSGVRSGRETKSGRYYQGGRKFDRRSNNHGRPHDGRSNGKDKSRHHKEYHTGVKTSYVSKEESRDPVLIRKQVEFYFSDSNLPTDRFLFNLVGGHENKPVPISTLHNFKRMRHFQPFGAVVDALKGSSVLEVVELAKQNGEVGKEKNEEVDGKVERDSKDEEGSKNEDKSKDEQDKSMQPEVEICVKRKTPLAAATSGTQNEIKKAFEDAALARSVYVKGFGKENYNTQFEIEAWFSEFGPTNAVRLRRDEHKTFKGSVFVEFDSEATAKNFVELSPPPAFRDRNLTVKSKKQYLDERLEGTKEGTKPDVVNRDWRELREEDKKKGYPPIQGGSNRGKESRSNDTHKEDSTATSKPEEKESTQTELTRKRSRDNLADDDVEEHPAKKIDTEGAASADKNDANVTDAQPEEDKGQAKEDRGAEPNQEASEKEVEVTEPAP